MHAAAIVFDSFVEPCAGAWLLSQDVGSRFYAAIDSSSRSREACRARLTAEGHHEGHGDDFIILSPPVELAELSNRLRNALCSPTEQDCRDFFTGAQDRFSERVSDAPRHRNTIVSE
eukprot:SAG31_NODE_2500_length_5595_cov_4.571143_6_plen_117_part_00